MSFMFMRSFSVAAAFIFLSFASDTVQASVSETIDFDASADRLREYWSNHGTVAEMEWIEIQGNDSDGDTQDEEFLGALVDNVFLGEGFAEFLIDHFFLRFYRKMTGLKEPILIHRGRVFEHWRVSDASAVLSAVENCESKASTVGRIHQAAVISFATSKSSKIGGGFLRNPFHPDTMTLKDGYFRVSLELDGQALELHFNIVNAPEFLEELNTQIFGSRDVLNLRERYFEDPESVFLKRHRNRTIFHEAVHLRDQICFPELFFEPKDMRLLERRALAWDLYLLLIEEGYGTREALRELYYGISRTTNLRQATPSNFMETELESKGRLRRFAEKILQGVPPDELAE